MSGPVHEPVDHVMDSPGFEFFTSFFGDEVEIHLPKIFGLQITKFMILELIAAALIILIYVPLARRARNGALPRGRWWNCFESLLTFIRNEVARPTLDKEEHHPGEVDTHTHGPGMGPGLGPAAEKAFKDEPSAKEGPSPHPEHHGDPGAHAHHEPVRQSDRFVPFLWTMFLFILVCNLLGLIPYLGSPTANIYVTGALALCSLVVLFGASILKFGVVGFFKSLWPKIDVPYAGVIFSTMIFLIEFAGSFIKCGVLAIRLFANMYAGHMVLASILTFILMVGFGVSAGESLKADPSQPTLVWWIVTISSVVGVAALSLLELFVAFLQAYVFTFLTSLFLGMSLNPEH